MASLNSMSNALQTPLASRWSHRWAVALTCATFPLIWWGGFVTATGSGMAFRDWLTSDGVFMPFYPWLSSAGDKFIEHGHRLLGMAAGILTIALVAACWLSPASRSVRRFSLWLLAGVIAQGVLGGMRVVLDERVLALIHGCTGPLFFAAAAAMAAMTYESKQSTVGGGQARNEALRPLARLAVVTASLAYLQLVLGAIVRHAPLMTSDSAAALFQTAVYFHVAMAMVVAFHVLLLSFKSLRQKTCTSSACVLAILIVTQLLLGFSSWIVKYGMPAWLTRIVGETGHFNRASDLPSAGIVAAHGAVGSLIAALCVVVAVRAYKLALAPPLVQPGEDSTARLTRRAMA